MAKEITLEDMDGDDMESLESGALQLVPLQDQSGRRILISIPNLEKYRTEENLVRLLFVCMFRIFHVHS